MNTSERLSRQLRRLRTLAGISQRELADRAGLSQNVVQRIEANNGGNPNLDTLTALAAALNVSMIELLQLQQGGLDEELDAIWRELSADSRVLWIAQGHVLARFSEKKKLADELSTELTVDALFADRRFGQYIDALMQQRLGLPKLDGSEVTGARSVDQNAQFLNGK